MYAIAASALLDVFVIADGSKTHLDLDQDIRKGVSKRDVPQRQQHIEHLLAGGGSGGASQRASELTMRRPFADAQTEADEGVAEGGGHRHNRQPRDVLQARELRQHQLEQAEHHHERVAGRITPRAVPVSVEAVGPLHRASERKQRTSSLTERI